MAKSDMGKAIRAVAKEKLGANLVGIDVPHIYAVTFGLGCACLAVAAGLLMEAVDRRRHKPELVLLPADSVLPPEEREQVEAGDVVPLREERHP